MRQANGTTGFWREKWKKRDKTKQKKPARFVTHDAGVECRLLKRGGSKIEMAVTKFPKKNNVSKLRGKIMLARTTGGKIRLFAKLIFPPGKRGPFHPVANFLCCCFPVLLFRFRLHWQFGSFRSSASFIWSQFYESVLAGNFRPEFWPKFSES
jgi:hypothetical protein